ncbi:MAG: DNA polymerase III subunit alpha, partial [Opitutales bacterium]
GFNKSHSAAYAMLSYRTAYLKANYPVQFMAGVLGCELGNSDKLAHTLEECQAMGVSVLGPDVNASRENFAPVFDEAGNGSIRFGLAAIKGVGEGPAKAILAEREANGPYQDFRDFATRVDSKMANRRVMENLIRTGAFDSLGEERGDLLHNVEAILKELTSLQRDREAGQVNMFDMFEMGGGANDDTGKATASGLPKGPAMPLADKLQAEKELLGFYVSGHPMNTYRGISEQLDTFVGEEFRLMENRDPFRLCAVITGVAKKLSRRDNKPWAILTVATRSTSYEVCAYSETYEAAQAVFEVGRCVLIEGYIQRRQDDEVSLAATRVADLAAALPSLVRELTFVVSTNGKTPEFLETLRNKLEPAMGRVTVKVGFRVEADHILVGDIANSLKWSLPMPDYAALRAHPAVEDVLVSAPEPEIPQPAWARRKGA